MTIAEIDRAVKSKMRVKKVEAQERATYDYILAGLITRGMSIVMGSKQEFPSLEETYSNLFEDETKSKEEEIKKQQQKDNLSTLRFLQFAQSYNQRFKQSGGAKEDK